MRAGGGSGLQVVGPVESSKVEELGLEEFNLHVHFMSILVSHLFVGEFELLEVSGFEVLVILDLLVGPVDLSHSVEPVISIG